MAEKKVDVKYCCYRVTGFVKPQAFSNFFCDLSNLSLSHGSISIELDWPRTFTRHLQPINVLKCPRKLNDHDPRKICEEIR